jgi:putative endonuclease
MEKGGSTYIITNKNRSNLYTGATSDLESRVMEHRLKEYPTSFSVKYNAGILVYYENFDSIEEAIEREKQEMENETNISL